MNVDILLSIFFHALIYLAQETRPTSEETPTKTSVTIKGSALSSRTGAAPAPSTAPVTEEEIRSVLLAMAPVTTQDLVAKFKARLKSQEVV